MSTSPSARSEIVSTCRRILSGDVDLIEGCRQLARLENSVGADDRALLAPLVAIDSETEEIPVGEGRDLWSQEALARKDREVAPYIEMVRPKVLETCRKLLRRHENSDSDENGPEEE